MDTSGFYNNTLKIRAGKFVYGPGYELHVDNKDSYIYPVHDWYWFDNMEIAISTLNIDVNDFNFDLPEEFMQEYLKNHV